MDDPIIPQEVSGVAMDDRDIYDLILKLTAEINTGLADLRVQLQEVSTKLDERHVVYEEKISEVREDVENAFKRLCKLEHSNSRGSWMRTVGSTVATALLTAAAMKYFVQ
jgi:hypothetical protein